MFRRHRAAPADEPARGKAAGKATTAAANGDAPADGTPARKAASTGKGRPTPKRSEAAPRRQPMTAPGNRKQAVKQTREHRRTERARRTEGLRRGDPRYFPPRDRGPVRALARDYVDSHLMISEYNLYMLAVLFVLLFAAKSLSVLIDLLVVVILFTLTIEGIIAARRVRKLAAQRYPGESTQGLATYVVLRAIQLRRMRLPPPRVKRGHRI